MPNAIATRQNDPQHLRHFVASRVWYRRAKWDGALQATLATMVPLLSAYVLAMFGDTAKPWTTALAITISLLEVLALEPAQKRCRTHGANEQELYDCAVLQLPWPAGLAGSEPTSTETIEATARQVAKDPNFSKYRDWYVNVDMLPQQLGVLVCQRCNTWWDTKARKHWTLLLRIGVLVVFLVVIGTGIRRSYKVSDLILSVYAPLSPLILWFVKEEQKHRDAASLSERGSRLVTAAWNSAVAKDTCDPDETSLRDVQDAIYERRKNSPLVPTWLHRIQRKRFQSLMNQIVQVMVQEIRLKCPSVIEVQRS
jgi:hypothetical protein